MSSPSQQRNRGSAVQEQVLARKRSRTSSYEYDAGIVHQHHNASLDMMNTTSTSTSTSTSTNSSNTSNSNTNLNHTNQQLANEISNLKTELSKIQSIRNLDRIKAQNMEKRFKRHIISLEEDTTDATALAEEIRLQSEQTIEEMSEARYKAVKDARMWQERYMLEVENGEESSYAQQLKEEMDVMKKENELLCKKIHSMEVESEALRLKLSNNDANVNANESPSRPVDDDTDYDNHNDYDNTVCSTAPRRRRKSGSLKSPSSPAPPAVLSELNRTRVKLADSERLNRQLSRKMDDLQSKADQYVQYREKAQSAEMKIIQLEKEMKCIRRERETLRIVETRWTDFRKDLLKHDFKMDVLPSSESSSSSSSSLLASSSKADGENVPPEIASVLRIFHVLRTKVDELKDKNDTNNSKLIVSLSKIETLTKKMTLQETEMKVLKEEKQKLSDQSRKVDMELRTIQAQERIWKREANSMRSLLDTYKQMEQNYSFGKKRDDNVSSTSGSSGKAGDPTISGLQLSLTSANDEIEILKKKFDSANDDKIKCEKELKTLKEEHDRVRQKFEKLRDALFQEREKAEKAEKRSFEAEVMAGKGAFNPETTRVLHIGNNPLSIALREKFEKEIKTLKEELKVSKAVTTDSSFKGQAKGREQISELDAQKLNKRLKESFRAQIGHFREGVYLLTGYKIDMIADINRPRFKVRSMYAESENDVLEFIWPELEEGKSPVSLDILNTKMAKQLSKEPSFEYMKKYNSLPAFMAAVCLSLFEKQTMV